jgi:hypothetical protein
MIFSIALLIVIIFIAFRLAPVENKENAAIHGAGQIGLLAAVALFGVDYFTSYFYATGEMMSALHPYGLQKYGYIAVGVIALANFVFGGLYMYSLGIFNEGGGSYTASMRYLKPTLSLIVAVTLIEDYVLTIVVSALSGGDQLLSILNAYDAHWVWHFAIGAALAAITWYLTIRGRGESARTVFHHAGHLHRLDRLPWSSGCSLPSSKAFPARFQSQATQCLPWQGDPGNGHCLHERHGRSDRPGGHVQRHPVCYQRRCQSWLNGARKTASLQKTLGLLQRQGGHRPFRADILPVLRWHNTTLMT